MTAATARSGRPRSEQVDDRILSAAVDLLGRLGYDELTMEAVAAAAGVAKTTLYRRYPDKESLCYEAVARLKGTVSEPATGTVRGDLLELFEQSRRRWSGNGAHSRLMRRLAGDSVNHPQLYEDHRSRLLKPFQDAVLAVLHRGVEEGLIRPDVDLLWASDLLGATTVAHGLTGRRTSAAQLEFVLDTVLAGLRP